MIVVEKIKREMHEIEQKYIKTLNNNEDLARELRVSIYFIFTKQFFI